MQGNISRTGHLLRLALGFVRNLVGKNDQGIGITDLFDKITLVSGNALEKMAFFFGCGDVIFMQPVHTAYKCDAHIFSPCHATACAASQ